MIRLLWGATTAALVVVLPAAGHAGPPKAADHEHGHGHGRQADPVHKHLKAAKESIKEGQAEAKAAFREARKAAKLKAKEAHERTKAELREAGDEAHAELKSAGERLREAGDEAHAELKSAGERLREAGDDAKAELGEVQRGATEAALGVRQALRRGAARANGARKRLWAKWQARLHKREHIDDQMRLEFRKHARRQARLKRIDELAEASNDDEARRRVERLMAREEARHKRRMEGMAERVKRTEDRGSPNRPEGTGTENKP